MEVAENKPDTSITHIIKLLGSTDTKTRKKTLRSLLNDHLPSLSQSQEFQSKTLSNESQQLLKKLWKALFYCVWHADKLQAQSHIIYRLSSVLLEFPIPFMLHYFSFFFLTIRREWSGIDRLRLDKFYLLIRRFLHFAFAFLKKNSWDLELLSRVASALVDWKVYEEDKIGVGVNYHVASAFLEELKPFLPVRNDVVEVLLFPFINVMGRVSDKILLGKIKNNVFDLLLRSGNELFVCLKSGDEFDRSDDMAVFGSVVLLVCFSSKFYEMGSSTECCQGNRKLLFGLHQDFLKLEKDLASSGVDVSALEVGNVSYEDEEVPELVPIVENGMDMDNGSAGKVLKKGKKRVKRDASGNVKKGEKKKKKKMVSVCDDGSNGSQHVDGEENIDADTDDSSLLNDSVLANLKLQFEKIAAPESMDTEEDVASSCDLDEFTNDDNVLSKKKRRKRVKIREESGNQELEDQDVTDGNASATLKSGEKSEKKVKFSQMALIWSTQNPLPPESLRLPPSVTPRGSALKKGLPPGPVRGMASAKAGAQLFKLKKKNQNCRRTKTISLALQRVKQLKSLTTA